MNQLLLQQFMGPRIKTNKKKKYRKKNADFKPSRLYVLLCKLCVLNVIRKRRKIKLSSWHNRRFLCRIGGKKKKMFKWERKKKTLGAGKKKIYFCTKVILSLACVLCSPPPSFSFLLWAVIYVVEKRLIWRGKRQFYSLKHFFFVRFFSLKAERSRPLRHLSVTVAFTLPFSACRYRMGMSSLIIHFFSLVYFFF